MKKPLRSYSNCPVTELSKTGDAICYIQAPDATGEVVQKPVLLDSRSAVPGDTVDILLSRRKKKGMAQGQVGRVSQPADYRQKPMCPHFGTCGGCKWQHVPYLMQLEWKREMVINCLTRELGREFVQALTIESTLESPRDREYRNKMEYSFSARRWLTEEEKEQEHQDRDTRALGLFVPGFPGRVTDIRECRLQDHQSNEIRNWVRKWAIEHQLSFYDHKSHEGYLRTLVIRSNSRGEKLIILITSELEPELEEDFSQGLTQVFPEVTSVYAITNDKLNDSYGDLEMRLLWGDSWLTETLGNLEFHIGPGSFFQTNIPQTPRLYELALEYASPRPGADLVYDLYTGTGTIAAYLAGKAQRVIGLEYVEESVQAAKRSCAENGVHNAEFFAGDMKDLLTEEFFEIHGHPQIIVTDPPRAGMHESVVRRILAAEPQKIVYVSCNPASLARDLAILIQGYRIDRIQPVDMAPQTPHIETVVALSKGD